jgi:hypothetical protein
VFLPIVWLVLIASQESNMPGSTASYFFPILLFLQCFSLLLTVLPWMSSKCFLKPDKIQEDSPDGKLSTGVLQWYLNLKTGRRQSSPPGVRGTVAKTGKLTLQMKTQKQRQQTQNTARQRYYSSEDSRSSRSSSSSLPRNVNNKRNGQPGMEMKTQNQEQSKLRRENRQQVQQSSSMGSPVRMNIGTVQFNTIKYSESQRKSSRKSGMMRKYPTTNQVNVETPSESSDFEDEFIEAFEEIDKKNEKHKQHEDQHPAPRFALGSVQPVYKHHHFNRQIEQGYK